MGTPLWGDIAFFFSKMAVVTFGGAYAVLAYVAQEAVEKYQWLTAADMQGGAFTLTSLGSYGIEFFTPVINHPEAAILGVGAIRMQPVPPPGGQEGFVLQRQLPLSLTFDHRIVDGGPAARFLGEDAVARIGGQQGLDDGDLGRLVDHVRTLQRVDAPPRPAVPVAPAPPAGTGAKR
jgi:hypothetical protein